MSTNPMISMNPLGIGLIDQRKKQIYEAAVLYKNFLPLDKDKIEKDNVYMISKDYIDNLKEKIKYDENIELFKENTEKNFKKFVEKLGNCDLSYLEDGIIFIDINSFGDLDDLEDHIEKGFEFVSKEFLEKLEFEIDDKSPKVKFIKDLKNIIIIFSDESKLFIVPNGKEVQYHAIPAPVKSSKKNPPRRSNSILISNRNRRNF